jgi:hypothetical protein
VARTSVLLSIVLTLLIADVIIVRRWFVSVRMRRQESRGRVAFLQEIRGALTARQTEYFVQAFDAGKGAHLKPSSPIACKSASGALRTAERLALSKLAVVADSSTGDPEMGDYDDQPTVFFRKGQLSAAFD